jgi:hypothetical protein
MNKKIRQNNIEIIHKSNLSIEVKWIFIFHVFIEFLLSPSLLFFLIKLFLCGFIGLDNEANINHPLNFNQAPKTHFQMIKINYL